MQPTRKTRSSIALALAATLAVVATGCGSSGPAGNGEQAKPAAQVWRDARAATTGTRSLHVTGTITNDGQTVKLDLDMSKSGNGGGSIELEGDTLHLVVAKGLVYMKADAAAWAAATGGNGMAKYAGKWVMTPLSGSSISNFAEFASSTKFLANLTPKGKLTKGPSAIIWDGRKVVVLSDTTAAKIYISATGKPYVLHLTGGGKSSHGSMTFDQYGTAPLPVAPKGAVSYTS